MLTACGGVTYKDVVSHAEAHLYYPGSRVVSREGGDEERGGLDTGRSPAVATTDLATDATMSQVYAWYEGQLKSRGWKLRKTETIDGGYELFTRGTRDVFYISAAPGDARRAGHGGWQRGTRALPARRSRDRSNLRAGRAVSKR